MKKKPVEARLPRLNLAAMAIATCMMMTAQVQAATLAPKAATIAPKPAATTPCNTIESAPMVNVTVGKSFRLKTTSPVSRILLGNPAGTQAAQPKEGAEGDSKKAPEGKANAGVAGLDVILLSPSEIYLLGKSVGSTNIILLSRTGQCMLVDVTVGVDTASLQSSLNDMLAGDGSRIKVSAASDSLVLTGSVADSTRVDKALTLAAAYAGQSKVINMLSVDAPQQVMLEVKVAEISKKLLDQVGINLAGILNHGGWSYNWNTNFSGSTSNALGLLLGGSNSSTSNPRSFKIDGQHDDGLVKVLAEPTVMAISGQEGSFLAGGKIFIPVAQNSNNGGQTITLEEKEFGVALRFTPTVLDGGRINLKVSPEVSELNASGVNITGLNGTAILPSFTTRRAATTVQLRDGQSFAIGGLIKNNVTTNISAFPLLGEIPILGALFRSSSFQTDKSELIFVVTPRLVKPLPPNYALPTDNYTPPNRGEFFLGGKMEGKPPAAEGPTSAGSNVAQPAPPQAPQAPSGFEVK
ncbi:type II and III secretion system protein family protein [Vogesella sp. LYT5W]|uniref:Type II and III secretion system protein family protein n=1 Tax=Vogesella margarita TaxID=2984199 RepID=A0ABT5ISF6_9NEIS|nr:type II and III secretion system protein family protein [Vogesella margarita]MDC7715128.1 type II and III secretion system protein family protein [Vogesella margarita]